MLDRALNTTLTLKYLKNNLSIVQKMKFSIKDFFSKCDQ